MPLRQIKSGSPDLGAAWGATNRTYPDQATRTVRGDGDGVGFIGGIIHDFISYNHTMRFDFGQLLQSKLSTRDHQLLRGVAAEAESRGLPIYLVGGLLRDLALGVPVTDLDLVVEGDAIGFARALAAKFGGKVVTHAKFGTAKWTLSPLAAPRAGAHSGTGPGAAHRDHIDLISARSEKYHRPGQLPRVNPGGIDDDLRRRDFTINTLALRLDEPHFGELHDPFGARADLDRGIVRVLHPKSFLDDPTRMYRAVRYEMRYGFKMAPETLGLIEPARDHVPALSAQRVRHELDLILAEDQAAAMLGRLAELDLLHPIHAALPSRRPILQKLQDPAKPRGVNDSPDVRWLLWLVGLTAPQIRSINRRLHFRRGLLEAILAAAALLREGPRLLRWKPSKLTPCLDKLPLLAVQGACQGATNARVRDMLQEYLSRWRELKPFTTGKVLKAHGLAPGPVYRIILAELRSAWLDGSVASRADEKKQLEILLRRFHPGAKQSGLAPLHASRDRVRGAPGRS